MQWTPDRNAGFSTADFEQLYLPPIMDPVYGYQAVNVEAQRRNPGSFLHWMRRMIDARSRHPQLALGSYSRAGRGEPGDPRLRAGAVRRRRRDRSCAWPTCRRQAQPVEVPLQEYDGRVPVELLGKVEFPRIGELPYLLTLPPHGFFWFELGQLDTRAGPW